MAEIINLRHVRKQKQRDDKAKSAEANRAKFGQTKSEKQKADLEIEQAAHHLDGHKIDPPANPSDKET